MRLLLAWFMLGICSCCNTAAAETKYSKGLVLPGPEERLGEDEFEPQLEASDLPTSYDLRALGLVTGVKDQGRCGSCWAFAATSVLETMAAKKFGKLVALSEQEIVSCARQVGVQGCDGGNVVGAWLFTESKGQAGSSAYPYASGRDGVTRKCQGVSKKAKLVGSTGGYRAIRSEEDMKEAIVSSGSVAIAISTDKCLMEYKGGILTRKDCPCDGPVDHAVTVVGYGVEDGVDYWIVRNSWGAEWGEKGYVRFQRGVNQCNLLSFAAVPAGVGKTKYFPK